MMKSLFAFVSLALAVRAQYTATYIPADAPAKSESGQSGTNQCGTGSSPDSMCQNVYINSVDDFCLFAPPSSAAVGVDEQICVSYCMRDGYGTRLIPDGTITGATFIQTPEYVQITGVGDLTRINIAPGGDNGGELDPHGATGEGNPIGGLVFGDTFGGIQQYHEWTNFMGANQFCLRACRDGGRSRALCQHIYDQLGCFWNMPGNYDAGTFQNCDGDSTQPMGLYTSVGADGKTTTSTFRQGQPATPPAHPAGASSNCVRQATVQNQAAVSPTATFLGGPLGRGGPTSTSTATVTTTVSNSTTSTSTTAAGNSTGTTSSTPAPAGTAPPSAAVLSSAVNANLLALVALGVLGAGALAL